MRAAKTILFLSLVAIGACAQDDGDVETAAQGWRAASIALDEGTAQLEEQADVEGHGDVTVGCPGGGQLHLTGTALIESGATGEHVSVAADVEFDGCAAEGVVIDGTLHVRTEVTTTETSTTVDVDYDGTLQWSGEIEGSCDLDVEGQIATESAGDQFEVRVEMSGSVCGADADAVIEAANG